MVHVQLFAALAVCAVPAALAIESINDVRAKAAEYDINFMRTPGTLTKRGIRPRCKYRNPVPSVPVPNVPTPTSPPYTETPIATPTGGSGGSGSGSGSGSGGGSGSGSGSGGGGTGAGGVISVVSTCGDIGATPNILFDSGPNGSEAWINCGLQGSGWRPQFATLNDIVYEPDLAYAMTVPGNPFGGCGPYVNLFNSYGSQYNIPPILLASFAMQESSCNPNAVGGGGEQGMMQISQDKCGGAPGGNCLDAAYNVQQGALFLRNRLDANGGNVIKTIGEYNGWYEGMTEAAARAMKSQCCRCQQNLDYVHAMLNGWLQNHNAGGLGTIFNLNDC